MPPDQRWSSVIHLLWGHGGDLETWGGSRGDPDDIIPSVWIHEGCCKGDLDISSKKETRGPGTGT